MAAAATPFGPIRDALAAQSISNFAIISPSGQKMDASGDFTSDKIDSCAQILQHTAALLQGSNEKLKRVTISFDDAVYIATVTIVAGKPYGVVVKR